MKICINKQTKQKMFYTEYSYFIHVILNDYFNEDLLNKTKLELIDLFRIQVFTPDTFKKYFDKYIQELPLQKIERYEQLSLFENYETSN
jgi:hypothetical protein